MTGQAKAILATITFILAVTGCSTHHPMTAQAKELARQEIIETPKEPERPKWTHQTFYEHDQNIYASGGFRDGADYAVTVRLAKAEATKNLLESIEIKARAEFSTHVQGSNLATTDLGRFVSDGVAWTVQNIRVRGIRQNQIYYERYVTPQSATALYNAWVQLQISKTEYHLAQINAAQRLLKKSIAERNKDAEKEAKKLLQKLQEEPEST